MPQVKGSRVVPEASTTSEAYWLPEDAAQRDVKLKRLLRCEYDGFLSALFQTYAPEAGPLLCMPRQQVAGRLQNMVQGTAMLYGLILSGVANSALNPLNVEDFPEASVERSLANLYNLLATVQFAISALGSMVTIIVLVNMNAQPDTTIFRYVSNFDYFFQYIGLIGWSSLLLLTQCSIIICLRSDRVWAFVTVGATVFILVALMHHWAHGMRKTCPETCLHYYPTFLMSSLVSPFILRWFFNTKDIKAMAKHNANMMVQKAENNFGKDIVNKARREVESEEADSPSSSRNLQPGTTASGDISSEKGRELKAVITHALPDATADRCDLIVMGMLIEELTVPRLVGMARMSFGLHVLDGALRENNMRLQLLTGERMAIMQAVANIATQTAGADASLDGGITGIPRQHASYEPSHIAGSSFGCRDDARACRMHDLQQMKELFDAGLLDEEVYKDEQRALLAKYSCKVY